MTDMAETLPFHRYQYLQFQLHIVAIPLVLAIHQLDQTMSMAKETQWI